MIPTPLFSVGQFLTAAVVSAALLITTGAIILSNVGVAHTDTFLCGASSLLSEPHWRLVPGEWESSGTTGSLCR